MSKIKVDNIQPFDGTSGTVTISGITTFSGTSAFAIYNDETSARPTSPVEGEIRCIVGESGTAIEYYNGIFWVQI